MQIIITSTALAIVLFLCLYFAFREGLRLGMNVAKGKEIEPPKSPIKAVQEHKINKELEKKEKEFEEGIKAIFEYDPDSVK
jgi:preprotein translocase subunit SecF